MRHLLLSVLLLPGLASAEIYRWTDAQGRVHFGAQPGAVGAQPVEVKPQVVERDDATREREARTAQFYDARRAEKEQAQSRNAEANAKRSQECNQLRAKLERINQDGRYFRTDAEGNPVYYEAKEVEAARSRLSTRITERCG